MNFQVVTLNTATNERGIQHLTGDRNDIVAELKKRGFEVLDIRNTDSQADSKGVARRKKSLGATELSRLFTSLAIMTESNVAAVDAIGFYADGAESKIRKPLAAAAAKAASGIGIPDALAESGLFSDDTIGLIRASEEAAALDKGFYLLSDIYATVQKFKAETIKAIVSPAASSLVALGVLAFFGWVMVPGVKTQYLDSDLPVNAASAFLFRLFDVLKFVTPALLLAILVMGALCIWSPTFRATLTHVLMGLNKGIANTIMTMREYRLFSAFGLLINNNISAEKAMEQAANGLRGTPMYAEVKKACEAMLNGVNIAAALRLHTSCSKPTLHLVEIGENSNINKITDSLVKMLKNQADHHLTILNFKLMFISLITAISAIVLCAAALYVPQILLMVAQAKKGF